MHSALANNYDISPDRLWLQQAYIEHDHIPCNGSYQSPTNYSCSFFNWQISPMFPWNSVKSKLIESSTTLACILIFQWCTMADNNTLTHRHGRHVSSSTLQGQYSSRQPSRSVEYYQIQHNYSQHNLLGRKNWLRWWMRWHNVLRFLRYLDKRSGASNGTIKSCTASVRPANDQVILHSGQYYRWQAGQRGRPHVFLPL